MAKGCTASEVLFISTTQLYQYSSFFSYLPYLVTIEPEVFLPKYSQTTILHAAHIWSVVKVFFNRCGCDMLPHIYNSGYHIFNSYS